jgi:hypothetical protein
LPQPSKHNFEEEAGSGAFGVGGSEEMQKIVANGLGNNLTAALTIQKDSRWLPGLHARPCASINSRARSIRASL